MKPLIIGIGLCLIGMGSALSLVGHYDGILGAADPKQVLSRETTEDATARIIVLGTSDQAQTQFLLYRSQLVIPAPMTHPMNEGQWVPVRVDGSDAEAYLRYDGQAPAPGTLLVFEGRIAAHRPVYDVGADVVASKPILFLEPDEYHEPLIFKA